MASAVTCPLHNWVIDLATGKAQGADEGCVRTIPVQAAEAAASSWRSPRCRRDRLTAARTDGRRCRRDAHDLPLLRRRLRRGRPARRATGPSTIAGDPDHPGNFGRLCSKGAALAETLGLDGRLLHPEIGGPPVAWDEALDHVAGDASRETIAEHGPDSVAFYVSGQLLTEDYYVANKLMKGFIGSANIDTNSRLCMASAVAGHSRAFGADVVPGCYEDLEEADLVVLVGSNLAWCHPVLYQRLMAAKERAAGAPDRRRSIRAAPRPPRPPTCISPSRPDTDVALFDRPACLSRAQRARSTAAFVARHTRGLRGRAARRRDDLSTSTAAAAATGAVRRRARAFLSRCSPRTERTVTVFSQGVNQSVSGTDKVNAIINCHLADRPHRQGRAWARSRSPASPTPWAGARSAASPTSSPPIMDFEDADDRAFVRAFWNAPRMAEQAGPQGRRHVRRRRATGASRRCGSWRPIRRSRCPMPSRVREALANCPFVVVSDCHGRHRHAALRPCQAARRRLGREGRHGHQLRAPHLAPARLPAAPRRGAARLVDRDGGRPADGVRRGLRLQLGQPTSSASTRRCRRSPMPAGGRSISAASPASTMPPTTRSSPFSGRVPAGGTLSGRRASSPTGASPPQTGARASCRRRRVRPPRCPRPSARSSSIPAACATIGTR